MGSPVPPTPLAVWRSTGMGSGGRCVMTSGLLETLKWLVVSWDSPVPVPAGPEALLEGKILLGCAKCCCN